VQVFNELETSRDDENTNAEAGDEKGNLDREKKRVGQSVMDLVSTTLKKHKKHKQQATVKPIKASDERKMDEAIAMANMLASKSMHDLDKRHEEDGFLSNHHGGDHATTPNSASKKFHFRFPGKSLHTFVDFSGLQMEAFTLISLRRLSVLFLTTSTFIGSKGHSPKTERRHFTEEAAANADLDSLLTPGAVDAYRALIEGVRDMPGGSVPASPRSPTSDGDNGQGAKEREGALSCSPRVASSSMTAG